MLDYWQYKILAFLHDPPDKTIKLSGHKQRSEEILRLLGLKYDDSLDAADHISAAMQRAPIISTAGEIIIDFSQHLEEHKPLFVHPLSGAKNSLAELREFIRTNGYDKTLFNVNKLAKEKEEVMGMNQKDYKKMFLWLWRNLPLIYPLGNYLPADTRIPDHSIFDHMDVTSAIAPCLDSGISFLSFKLAPTQEFIGTFRTTSDLWAGSHIVSYLVFCGIKVVVDDCGPDALVFPYLRGQPFIDWWFERKGLLQKNAELKEKLTVANIPNRFLAIVPTSKANELSKKIREEVIRAWDDIARKVLDLLSSKGVNIDENIKRDWERQIKNAFQVTVCTFEWPKNVSLMDWFNNIKDTFASSFVEKYSKWVNQTQNPNIGILYGLYFELISLLIDQKSRIFEYDEEPDVEGGEKGGRCTICGMRNQIKAADVTSKAFWEDVRKKFPTEIRKKERLCAVCTTKRLYGKIDKINPFEITPQVLSVATITLKEFLEKLKEKPDYEQFINEFNTTIGTAIPDQQLNKENPEGEWFYTESYDHERINSEYGTNLEKEKVESLKDKLRNIYDKYNLNPQKYYAILLMDGDQMGKKLRGDSETQIKKFLHPTISQNIDEDNAGIPRILNPNIHMAISRALLEFSVNILGNIIKKYNGLLIYSGGDDLLAFLPAKNALNAAKEINDVFGKDYYECERRKVMLMGKGATMSAGIVFVHYKYPLYDALAFARNACEDAKEKYDRNAFAIVDIRHSGQISTAGGKWDAVHDILEFVGFVGNEEKDAWVSPRILYRLLEECEVIEKLDDDGKSAFLTYLIKRHICVKDENTKDEKVNAIKNKLESIINKYSANGKTLTEVVNALIIIYRVQREAEPE